MITKANTTAATPIQKMSTWEMLEGLNSNLTDKSKESEGPPTSQEFTKMINSLTHQAVKIIQIKAWAPSRAKSLWIFQIFKVNKSWREASQSKTATFSMALAKVQTMEVKSCKRTRCRITMMEILDSSPSQFSQMQILKGWIMIRMINLSFHKSDIL